MILESRSKLTVIFKKWSVPCLLLLFALSIFFVGCTSNKKGAELKDKETDPDIEIIEQDSFEYGDQIKMQGVARNNSNEIIDIVVISGSAYDEEGNVIGTGRDEITRIESDEEVAFEIIIDPTVEDLDTIQWHCTADVQ